MTIKARVQQSYIPARLKDYTMVFPVLNGPPPRLAASKLLRRHRGVLRRRRSYTERTP
jgi:hypothetical protein